MSTTKVATRVLPEVDNVVEQDDTAKNEKDSLKDRDPKSDDPEDDPVKHNVTVQTISREIDTEGAQAVNRNNWNDALKQNDKILLGRNRKDLELFKRNRRFLVFKIIR